VFANQFRVIQPIVSGTLPGPRRNAGKVQE